jgi:hypothetical protein
MPSGQPHPINRAVLVTYRGKLARIDEHAQDVGLDLALALARLRRGWSSSRTFATPNGEQRTTHEKLWLDQYAKARAMGESHETILDRTYTGPRARPADTSRYVMTEQQYRRAARKAWLDGESIADFFDRVGDWRYRNDPRSPLRKKD